MGYIPQGIAAQSVQFQDSESGEGLGSGTSADQAVDDRGLNKRWSWTVMHPGPPSEDHLEYWAGFKEAG